jgi:hypothetical protein
MTRNFLRWAGTVWIVMLVALSLQPVRLHATSHGTDHVVLHLWLFGISAVAPLLLSESSAP